MQFDPVKIEQDKYHKDYLAFLTGFPEYTGTQLLDQVRNEEFSRLEQSKHVYLDYTGASFIQRASNKKNTLRN